MATSSGEFIKPLKRSEKNRLRKAYEKKHRGKKYKGDQKWKHCYYSLWVQQTSRAL